MKLIQGSVSLEYVTPLALVTNAARASYQSYDGQNEDGDERLLRHFVKNDESPLEFSLAVFSVTCSYAAHVHLVRHRTLRQSWLSQRYTEGLGFILPPSLSSDEVEVYKAAFQSAEDAYEHVRRQGASKKQDARYLMPQATAMQGWIAGDARNLLNMLRLRSAKKAMPETRQIALEMQSKLMAAWPALFEKSP